MRLGRLEVTRLMTAMVAAATLAACSGSDDGGNDPTPTIDIALSAATLSVAPGANGTVTVTLTRAGGFNGDVAVTVEGAPTGVTAPAATIAAAATSAVVTVAAAATTTPGTYPLTVRATGTGVTAKTAALSLTVTAAPTYALTLAPTALTVTQGGAGTVAATITRTGAFAGAVTLAAEGLPTGVTAAFAPNNTTTNASTITFTATAGATVGPATVTIRGTATGQTDKTATVALTISAPTPGSYTLAATPATVTVAPGANGTANVAVTRTGGFAGAITFAAEGLPTGVTAAFAPNNTTTDASVLTLTVAANAAAGTSTITVRGTAAGQTDKTATFQLTISAPAGSYTIAVTPATVTAVQGATGTANVALTRTGGFAGAVTFAAEGLPTGVTAAFAPNNTTTDASVLTLTAAANATAGTSTITVRGTAAGQTDKTATFQLTVSAPAGGFTLTAAPTTVTAQQGASGVTTVTINRTNAFAGTVNLTATGLPTGVTATFNPAAATANTSTLTLAASGTATVGTATVTIRGNATGLTEQTTPITLNVTAAVGGSGNTTWEFCNVADMPLWLAVQDGANGTWTRVNPTGTKFQFNITQAKAGIAYVFGTTSPSVVSSVSSSFAARMSASLQRDLLARNRPTRSYASSSLADSFTLSLLYGTQAELNSQGTSPGRCTVGVAGKTVNGSVANVGPTQLAFVSLGSASATVTGASGSTFQLKNVQSGALDLLASRAGFDLTTGGISVDKLIIRRGLNQADGSTIPALDFNAAEAFVPVTPNITLGNLNGEVGSVATLYYTSGFGTSTTPGILFSSATPSAGPFTYVAVPAAKQVTGDLHFVQASAYPSLQNLTQIRTAGLFFKDATDRTVTLGPALSAPTVTAAATAPYVRFRATGAVQAEYNKSVSIQFSQTAAAARSVIISATEGYLAGSATYDFTIPDFTGVAGWDNNWGPKAGAATQWYVSGVGYTGLGISNPTPIEGVTFFSGSRFGTITP